MGYQILWFGLRILVLLLYSEHFQAILTDKREEGGI